MLFRSETVDLSDISLVNLSIRIGSDSWTEDDVFDDSNYNTLTFDLAQISAIHRDNISLYSTIASLESQDFKHYYTLIANSSECRFTLKSFTYAKISIPLQSLYDEENENFGASKIEIGNPVGNSNVKVYVTGNKYDSDNNLTVFQSKTLLSEKTITNASWLYPSISDGQTYYLDFDIEMYSDDALETPPVLDYFRLFTYPVITDDIGTYTTSYSTNSGNPVKIYQKNNGFSIPDLTEKPFFYNGFNSGIKIDNCYGIINHNFTSPDRSANITGKTSNEIGRAHV